MTAIWSAPLMVDRRWAMTSTVICPPERAIIASIACCTRASDSASRAEVASSRSSTRGLRTRARAMATRCFCPPESCTPFSPTWVLYASGKALMKPCALASLHACTAASRRAGE
mmetsp:Transcript_5269/g.17794  ORF Transcript_5269/g.17794 Transcript_5269/m.17794 type:complete len:114 (-) Transcript_5269:293-634(-)